MLSDTPQIWGSPEVDGDIRFFGNFGYTSDSGFQPYAHTNFARKRVTGGFFFRNPNTRGGVFSADGGQTLPTVPTAPEPRWMRCCEWWN